MKNRAEKILECIRNSENGVLSDAPNQTVEGFAGDKLTGLIQRTAKLINEDYIEVGVWRGSSLLNTAYANPDIHCYGIDNYSQVDPNGTNKSIVIETAEKLGVTNYTLVDKDFEIALLEQPKGIGIYFIDGPHDYRSQLLCLAYAPRFLTKGGVIFVDDANYPHVRQATADFLNMFPEYKLVFEAYTSSHPDNMDDQTIASARKGYWDGVNMIVHDPENEFERLTPPVPSNERFIRDHYVHIIRYAPVAAEATMVMQAISRPWQLPKAIGRFLKALLQRREQIRGRNNNVNTESENLMTRTAKIRAN